MTGAVIVAAGMSSRMGEFKPLMTIGAITMVERIVQTFQVAGVENIVIVTGYHAKELENKIRKKGIIYLHNSEYEVTEMFDSAKIGFSYLKEKCDTILFTPVDIPLFTVKTVRALVQSGKRIAVPSCRGRNGHPLFLHASLLEQILAYEGDGGLRAAIAEIEEIEKIEVDDEGILYDADTRQDYSKLIELHSKELLQTHLNISIGKEIPFLERETIQLLKQIEYAGSVRKACEQLNISYSRGRCMILALEEGAHAQIVKRYKGGAGGGNAFVTETGKSLIRTFEEYEKEMNQICGRKFLEYFQEFDF